MTEEEIKKSLSGSLQKAVNKNEQERDKDDQPFLPKVAKTLEDIAVQTAGGIVDASESAYNFVVPKSMEVEYSDIVPEAETTVGQFIRPAAQFFIPYTGAFKIAKGGYMYVKNAKQLNSTVKDLVSKGIKKENIITKKSKDGQKFVFLEKGKVKQKVEVPTTKTIKTKTTKEVKPKTSNEVLMLQLGGSPKTITIQGTKKIPSTKTITKIKKTTKKVDEKPIKTSLTKGETEGIAIGAGKLSEFIENKIAGGSSFSDAHDKLDQILKDNNIRKVGNNYRVFTGSSKQITQGKGSRRDLNAEEQKILDDVLKKREALNQLRDDMRAEMDVQKATVEMTGTRSGGRDKGKKFFSKEDNEKKAELEAGVRADFEAKIPDIVGLQTGGKGARGRSYLVGERGPELFTPNTDGQITNSNETLAMLADGANQVNIITEDLPPITTPMPDVPIKDGVTANEAEPVSSVNPLNDYMMFTPQLLGIE